MIYVANIEQKTQKTKKVFKFLPIEYILSLFNKKDHRNLRGWMVFVV